jgi:hypothetical protein
MIRLDKLTNNGKPIVFYYDVATTSYIEGSFALINTDNAVAPSNFDSTNAPAASGIYDHIFVIAYKTVSSSSSYKEFGVGIANPSLIAQLDDVISGLTTDLTTVDKIYFCITDIQYIGIGTVVATSSILYHVGMDVYVA